MPPTAPPFSSFAPLLATSLLFGMVSPYAYAPYAYAPPWGGFGPPWYPPAYPWAQPWAFRPQWGPPPPWAWGFTRPGW